MNAKQSQILRNYQRVYPQRTLREMSKDLEINISRVFRLLNGYEMKLSEYEKIESALSRKKIKTPNLYELTQKCQNSLSSQSLEQLMEEMEMLLHCKHQSIVKMPEGA